jgi:phosphoserine phosphatase
MPQAEYRINLFSSENDASPGAALAAVTGDDAPVAEFIGFTLATATWREEADPAGEEINRRMRKATDGTPVNGAWRASRGDDRSARAVVLGKELDGPALAAVLGNLNSQGLIATGLRVLSSDFRAVEFRLNGALADATAVTQAARDTAVAHGVDVAVLPGEQTAADFGLLMMDMDSTLLAVECIDEIAEHAGVKDQVAAITERAMNGELDFKGSLVERVKMLKGLPREVLESVYRERIVPNPGARRLVETCRGLGIKVAVVSGGFTFFTELLEADFGLDFTNANVLEVENGHLTGQVLGDIVDGAVKAATLRDLRDRLGLERGQLIAMGDGANDLPMIAESGLGLAFHAKPRVQEQAPYNLSHNPLDGLLYLLGLTDKEIHTYRSRVT